MYSTGKVYLVGAGPGHPELLTLKAAELIRRGDVIVYDRLIQEEVLALAKPSAERIYMGKPVGRHDSRQDEINELLVRKAREGKTVVRLKGGDPFLFGRGGEEAEYLAGNGIPFEVIPGVCSALSAPLSAGIPVTHRDYASAVTIVTGHNAATAEDRLDWRALARCDTLVLLMAVHNTGTIARKLIQCGRSPQTPAAIIQMAFWHEERVVIGTLEDIADRVCAEGIKPPATLVIGEVVRVREKLQGAQRDLQRYFDSSVHFQPGPGPDQLLRLAAGGMAAKVLGWALQTRLFDRFEEAVTAYDFAAEQALDAQATSEILRVLVALGLLESRPEGYRNLELASRYLTSTSPMSLRELLLYNCTQTEEWQRIAEFTRTGVPGKPGVGLGEVASAEQRHAACEAMARFAAPGAVEKLADVWQVPVAQQVAVASRVPTLVPPPRKAPGQVLVAGWGGDAHRDALLRRWPDAHVAACNPLKGEPFPKEGGFDWVILAGALEGNDSAQFDGILDCAVACLAPQGQLMLHDRVTAAGSLPAAEIALASLAKRMVNPAHTDWTAERLAAAFERHGLAMGQSDTLFAGYTTIFAARAERRAQSAARVTSVPA
jgi:uroporphyrin-III C-methyltransferase